MYYHLTQDQRIELSLMLRLGHSQRKAATVLGVSPSTVCREIRRNTPSSGSYHATHARVTARSRRTAANALRNKLLSLPRLAELVERQLIRHDSPEQIVERRSGYLLAVLLLNKGAHSFTQVAADCFATGAKPLPQDTHPRQWQ
jgi:IS30 family transposase